MYPNENQPTPTPEDYLNQIAPKITKKTDILQNKLVIIGGISIVVVLIAILIANIASGMVNQTEQLAARLLSTEVILDNATSKTKSTQLQTSNGNLKLYLTNTIRDITPILKKEAVNINNLSKKVKTTESNTSVLSTLEDARLNAIYDRVYAREMSYKLDTIITLMDQIQKSSSDKAMKLFLQDAIMNLKPIQTQFADFNAANS